MKTAIKTIVVLLLIAVIAGLGWMTFGFREWDPEVWKDEIENIIDEEQRTEEQPVTDGEGNEMASDESNPLPAAMVFSSALNLAGEATSVTVTATLNPSTVRDELKAVDWSVSWKNSSSSWASGKSVTDYVTVTPTSDGSATATVACSQAFGEQIILTCTSRYFTDVKATATVDYRANVTGFSAVLNYSPRIGLGDSSDEFDVVIDSNNDTVYLGVPKIGYVRNGSKLIDSWGTLWALEDTNLSHSTGTVGVLDEVTALKLEVKLDPNFIQTFKERYCYNVEMDESIYDATFYMPTDWYVVTTDVGGVSFADFFQLKLKLGDVLLPFTVSGMSAEDSAKRDQTILYEALLAQALSEHLGIDDYDSFAQLRVTPQYRNGTSTVEGESIVFKLGLIDYAQNLTYISSITLNDSAIEF